nr:MoaD/ThiS family protein [Anaerolineae bacterium]
MPVVVRIPTPLRRLTGNQARINATGQDVRGVLDDLERRYPGFRKELYDDSGSLKRFINVYVNGREIRSLDGEDTLVSDGDELSIIPAIAGGAHIGRNAIFP